MKRTALTALALLLACLWALPAAASGPHPARRAAAPPVLAASGLAPDAVPAFPAPVPAATAGGSGTGDGPPAEQPSVREEARHYVREALPVLPGTWRDRERFWSSPPVSAAPAGNSAGGAAWNEFYLRHFRLSLSTMPDEDAHLKHLVPGETTESRRWEQFRDLPGQLRSGSFRDTAESLGAVVEPRIRLGIEF